MDIFTFPDRGKLIAALSDRIGTALSRSISKQGRASLAVSGGSTPKPLFRQLSGLDLLWQQVVVTLVDERWVDPGGSDSNEQLVRQHLLQNRAAAAGFIGLKNAAPSADQGEAECERHLQEVPRPFTILILGMGNDGHTASLFPGADRLAAATDMDSGRICMAVTPKTAPHARMTLTLPAILDAEEILLHITGPDKKAVLDKALTDGPPEVMPIRYVLRQQTTPVTVYWAA
ncbi:MAG: 6-phosphogluconolactonase [Candidatus Electrothrix sp. YB6]